MKRSLILFMVLGLIAGSVATAGAAPGAVDSGLTKLTASDGVASDRFGISVAVSGDTAVVGAPWEEAQRGAAYVYTRVGRSWVEQAKLTASDGIATLKFGFAVAISGDTIVVGGSPYHGAAMQGSAYVFERDGYTWTEQAKLTASDGANGDNFGHSVAVSGDAAVIGAYGIGSKGAAYVFTPTTGAWTQKAKLTASDGAAGDNFGQFVAVSGDTAVIGTVKGDGSITDQGSAYVFTGAEGHWNQEDELTANDGSTGDEFGFWVGVSGDTAVVGAINDDVGANIDQGSAYVFTRTGTSWTQQTQLTAPDGAAIDRFGRSAAISGNTIVVGAQNDDVAVDDHALTDQGSAYVFSRKNSTWTQHAKLVASDGGMGDLFGVSVGVSRGTAVIGAGFHNLNQGAAYIWEDSRKRRPRLERTVEGEYGPYPAPVTGCNGILDPFACLVVRSRSKESYFTAKVTDLHGQPVFVQVKSGGSETIATFCGETERPIRFRPGATLEFMLVLPKWPAEMHLDCPANRIKTTGRLSVTLSNVP